MRAKINNSLHWLFWFCFIVVVWAIFASRNQADFPFFRLEILALFILIYIFSKKIKNKYFPFLLFGLSFFIRVFCALLIQNEPVSDFNVLYKAAEMLSKGDTSFNTTSYFQTWSYQTGFVMWEAFLLKIVNSVVFLKIVNCAVSAGINLLIYYIAQELFDNKVASRTVSIVYMIFPFAVLHTNVLSNSHISAFFLFFGVLLLIKGRQRHDIIDYGISGLSIALGNIFRPDGLILLVALGAVFFFDLFGKEKIVDTVKKVVAFFGAYLGLMVIASNIIVATGINPNGLKNEDPLWKFVLGTNYESKGGYSDTDLLLIEEYMGKYDCSYEEAEKQIIIERIHQPMKLLSMMQDKVNTMWWSDGITWSFSDDFMNNLPTLVEQIRRINREIWYFTMLLLVLSVGAYCKLGKRKTSNLIIPFIIFATFVVYLLIEVQPRYAYMVQIAVFIMAAGGLDFGESKLKNWKEYILKEKSEY